METKIFVKMESQIIPRSLGVTHTIETNCKKEITSAISKIWLEERTKQGLPLSKLDKAILGIFPLEAKHSHNRECYSVEVWGYVSKYHFRLIKIEYQKYNYEISVVEKHQELYFTFDGIETKGDEILPLDKIIEMAKQTENLSNMSDDKLKKANENIKELSRRYVNAMLENQTQNCFKVVLGGERICDTSNCDQCNKKVKEHFLSKMLDFYIVK